MVNVYKGKGDALECGLYHNIKLQNHVRKILERVIKVSFKRKVNIHGMQFVFSPGNGATDAICANAGDVFVAKEEAVACIFRF